MPVNFYRQLWKLWQLLPWQLLGICYQLWHMKTFRLKTLATLTLKNSENFHTYFNLFTPYNSITLFRVFLFFLLLSLLFSLLVSSYAILTVLFGSCLRVLICLDTFIGICISCRYGLIFGFKIDVKKRAKHIFLCFALCLAGFKSLIFLFCYVICFLQY